MGCSASDDKLDMVVDSISRDQIELTFLLPQYFDDEMDESWQSDEKDDHGEGSKFGEATNGASEVKQKKANTCNSIIFYCDFGLINLFPKLFPSRQQSGVYEKHSLQTEFR